MPFVAVWLFLFAFAVHLVAARESSLLRGNSALVTDGDSQEQTLFSRWPYYHSSDNIHSLLAKTVADCKTGVATLKQGNNAGLDIVSVRAHDTDGAAGGKPVALFVAGEHARELFAVESAVRFVRALCGLEPDTVTADRAQRALADSDFVIVPNANPQGRRKVEAGAYCKRTNENGVDLNRNYGDSHRDNVQNTEASSAAKAGSDDDDLGAAAEDNPGPSGFSEPETQDIRDVAGERTPRLFLSIHTGAYLLGMPYGDTDKSAPRHADEMLSALGKIKMDHCPGSCPFGSLDKVIGYKAKGCSMDYMIEEAKVPYSFTWEIFADKQSGISAPERKEADEQIAEADAQDPGSKWTHMVNGFSAVKFQIMDMHMQQGGDSTKAGTMSEDARIAQDEACFKRFNPHDEAVFNKDIKNWVSAYFDLADEVAAQDPHFVAETDSDSSSTTSTTTADPSLSGDDMAWLKSMKSK